MNDLVSIENNTNTQIGGFLGNLKKLDEELEALQKAKLEVVIRIQSHTVAMENLKQQIKDSMNSGNIKTLTHQNETGSYKLTLKKTQASVVIDDETLLPEECKKVKVEPNKQLIKAKLSAGQAVTGAHLSEPGQALLITHTTGTIDNGNKNI